MKRHRLVGGLAAVLLLTGCGVRSQSKPEKIDTPASSPTPTPTIQRSACPTAAPSVPPGSPPTNSVTTGAGCAIPTPTAAGS